MLVRLKSVNSHIDTKTLSVYPTDVDGNPMMDSVVSLNNIPVNSGFWIGISLIDTMMLVKANDKYEEPTGW